MYGFSDCCREMRLRSVLFCPRRRPSPRCYRRRYRRRYHHSRPSHLKSTGNKHLLLYCYNPTSGYRTNPPPRTPPKRHKNTLPISPTSQQHPSNSRPPHQPIQPPHQARRCLPPRTPPIPVLPQPTQLPHPCPNHRPFLPPNLNNTPGRTPLQNRTHPPYLDPIQNLPSSPVPSRPIAPTANQHLTLHKRIPALSLLGTERHAAVVPQQFPRGGVPPQGEHAVEVVLDHLVAAAGAGAGEDAADCVGEVG